MKQLFSQIKEVQEKIAELQMPIQEQIQERVQEQKEQVEIPEQTRSASKVQRGIDVIGKIAKKLFSKEEELTEPQKSLVVNELNNVGDELLEESDEQISKIGEELMEVKQEDLTDIKTASKKVAMFAKKLIIASQTCEECSQIQMQKLEVAQKLVKIASLLKQKKNELTAKQKVSLQKTLMKLSDRVAAFQDGFTVDKSDIIQDFQKSNRYLDRRLNNCVDWEALKTKSTSRIIKPTTQLKDITLEDLRKIMTTLRGIK